MDLEISPGDIDRTHRIGVPSKGRPIIVKFVRCMDRRYLPTKRDWNERTCQLMKV